jgi:hypothetical protein
VNALERSEKSATTALLDAEVDEAIATCGGDVRTALRTTLAVIWAITARSWRPTK